MTTKIAPNDVLAEKWRIGRLLGEGGMGAVFSAVHVRNGRQAAIKVLRDALAKDDELRERFQREGYAANRVGHPGIVQVLDDGTTPDGAPFLVMELLDGRSLEQIVETRGGHLPLGEVIGIVERWLDVVAAAHAVGVVHRDLKPENVFICNDGKLKVLDFGLAQIKDEKSGRRLTAMGIPMGTPAFMPPEQAMAHWDRVDARSDVFSLGASIFNMLSGHIIHEGLTPMELIVKTSTQPVRPLLSVAPHVPVELAAVIDRALRFDPNDRFADAGEMLEAWRRATLVKAFAPTMSLPAIDGPEPAQGHPTMLSGAVTAGAVRSVPSVTTMSPVSSGPRRKIARTIPWIALVVAAGLLSMLGYAWSTRSSPRKNEMNVAHTGEANADRSAGATVQPIPGPASATTGQPPAVVVAPAPSSASSAATSAGTTASAAPSTRVRPPLAKPSATNKPKPDHMGWH